MGWGRINARVWPFHVVVAVMVGIYALMLVRGSGVHRLGTIALIGAMVTLWIVMLRSSREPGNDRHGAPVIRTTGAVEVHGSRPLAALLAGSWALVVVGTALWGLAFVRGEDIPSPGFTLVMALAVLASLPTVVRAALGRLPLWRLTLDDTGLRYVGGRTRHAITWRDVERVGLDRPRTHLVVRDRATSSDVVVPILGFDLPAAEVLALVEEQRPARTP